MWRCSQFKNDIFEEEKISILILPGPFQNTFSVMFPRWRLFTCFFLLLSFNCLKWNKLKVKSPKESRVWKHCLSFHAVYPQMVFSNNKNLLKTASVGWATAQSSPALRLYFLCILIRANQSITSVVLMGGNQTSINWFDSGLSLL